MQSVRLVLEKALAASTQGLRKGMSNWSTELQISEWR